MKSLPPLGLSRRGNRKPVALAPVMLLSGASVLVLSGDLRGQYAVLAGGLLSMSAAAWMQGLLGVRAMAGERDRIARSTLWTCAAGLAVLVLGRPSLSDDVERYLWEGRAQRQELAAPYLMAPSDPRLPDEPSGSRSRVAHPHVSAAYPPLAELTLHVTTTAADLGGLGARGFQILFALCHLATAWLLLRRARAASRRAFALALVAALHPLALFESALGSHLDALAALLMTIGVIHFLDGKPTSGAWLGLSVMVKPWALVVMPLLARLRGRWRAALWGVGAMALCVLPYAAAGSRLFAGLGEFATRWEFNAGPYRLVEMLVSWPFEAAAARGRFLHLLVDTAGIALDDRGVIAWSAGEIGASARRLLVDGRLIARGVCAGLLIAVIGATLRRLADRPAHAALLSVASLFALSPTVHPWYGTLLVPLAALAGATRTLGALMLLPLAYAVWRLEASGVVWSERSWTSPVFFGVFLVALAWDVKRSRSDESATQASPAANNT